MKKRSREDDASWICDLGSEWMSKRRKISRVDDEDGGGISEVGLQWMSSRPSLRKANGCSRSASDASKSLLPAQNLDHGERWRCSRTESRQNVKTRMATGSLTWVLRGCSGGRDTLLGMDRLLNWVQN
jgi:hypothetical protein